MFKEAKNEVCRIATKPGERLSAELISGLTLIAASWDPEIYGSAHNVVFSAGAVILAAGVGEGLAQIASRIRDN